METTLFLAQLWGPAILAVGLGIFTSRGYYIRIYRDLDKDAFAGFLFGMSAIVVGTAHVLFHNLWNSPIEMVISFLGWGLLVKGILFVVAPRFVVRASSYWAKRKLLPLVGLLTVVVGAYLVWWAYF